MASWDLRSLWQTLVYFEAVPLLTQLRQLQGRIITPHHHFMNQTILVIGGVDHLSQRVIKQLWQKGYQPRLLVADPELAIAQQLFPQGVDIVSGDLNNLPASIWQQVRAVIYCPENVSQANLDRLVQLTNQHLPTSSDLEIFDFTATPPDIAPAWGAVDDVVMGGISSSSLQISSNCALFTGNISTENSGGFASIRTRNFEPALDLSNYQGISLRVRGDGKRYKLFLRTSAQWDGLGYAYSFDTNGSMGNMTNLRIPFSNLVPVMRAKTVPAAPPIDPSQIMALQIMLSKFEYDGHLNPNFRAGDFVLELFSIGAYGDRVLPQLIVVAPLTTTTGNLAQPLAGSLKPYTTLQMGVVVDRPGGQNLEFNLKELSTGSVSSEDLAELCVQLLNIPTACQQTINVQEIGHRGVNSWSNLVEKAVQSS
jgi:Complex I intermediate-associated protein 30 (CIA30)/NmrA-like family